MADNLADIIARLEKASGPDPELDEAMWTHLIDDYGDDGFYIPPFTASLDAAVALAARVLPGCDWQVAKGGGCTIIHGDDDEGGISGCDNAPTPAIGLCLAIVRAVAAKGTPHGR